MTSADAVRAATARGLRFGLENGIVFLYGKMSVIDEMMPTLSPHKADIAAALREHDAAMTVSDVAIAAAKLLHIGMWPPTSPSDCSFHWGEPGKNCGRCGAAWREHNGIASNPPAKPKKQRAQ